MSEVKRIREEMSALLPESGFKGGLDEFLAYARTNPDFYFDSGDKLLDAYRAAVQRIEPLLPKVVRSIPKLSLRVEGTHGGAAGSFGSVAKHNDDGIFLETGSPAIHPKFEIIPLILHEGLPGHAFQAAVARDNRPKDQDAVADFEQDARQSSGFVEGWGLYSETLGHNLGLHQTPMDEFGALRMELTRAVRVAVDTGVHLSGWSIQHAKQYAAAQTGEPDAQVELEVMRALLPGSSPAYKVGEQEIQAMRDRATKKLGAKFDLAAFHDTMLRWGPLPLKVMDRKLDECLADDGCSLSFTASTTGRARLP